MQLGTFTANVIVDGKALEEYDVVSKSPTKVTCWIASEEGKSFGVQWKCHEESRIAAARGWVYADGIRCTSRVILPGTLGVQDTKTLSRFTDGTQMRDLMFARVQLSDDDSLLNKEIHKNLGEIALVIEHGEIVRELRSGRGSADHKDPFVPGNNERLHERSKKATVHCVGFGPDKTRTRSRYGRRLIRNSQPKITFVFKYQPLSVLQANGLAPRPTSTTTDAGYRNGSGERDVGTPDDHSSEDIKPTQLSDRIQDLENELKRLRDLQASNPEDRKPKRIKFEDPGERRRLFVPGEIIDLT